MPGKNFIIATKRSEFAVKGPDGIIYSRSFEVVINDVVGLENYKIVNSSAKAMIDYNYVYEATEEFDGKHTPIFYFNEYKNVDKSPKMTTEEIDGPDETTVRYNFATTPLYALWKTRYIDKGLANLYATYKGILDDWGVFEYRANVALLDSGGKTLMDSRSYGWFDEMDFNPNNDRATGNFHSTVTNVIDNTPALNSGHYVNHYVYDVCCLCKNNFNNSSNHRFISS